MPVSYTYRLLVFFFLMVLNISGVLFAQELRVCTSCTYSSINEAVTAAEPGSVIRISPGLYKEHDVLIDKELRLIGEKGVLIDGEQKGSILRVEAAKVEISGLELQNVGFSHTEEFAAIHLYQSSDVVIRDNQMKQVYFGVLIERSKAVQVLNNQISGEAEKEFYSGNGIHAWHSSDLQIEGNEVYGLRDGIYLEFVDQSSVRDNLSYENIRYGLHFMFSDEDGYYNNEFRDNGAGVAVMFSKNIEMVGNNFYHNWGTAAFGLLLKEIYDAEILNNDFHHNTVAIQVEGSTRVNYTRNRFRENGWAVKFSGGCYANIFTYNDFSYNSFDLAYNSKLNDNQFDSNYWSSYTGYDLDRDGIGDTPYRPVKLFSYLVNRTPESVLLMRSLFMDFLEFSEKVSPVFTPDYLLDAHPLMEPAL